jgi:DNA/RNA endonuclease YhcR with UshA esterase domain
MDYRANFPRPPETYYLGRTICVTGLIEEYNGIPQIEVKTPDQIEER